jgi:hypothetical protein
VGCRQFPSDRGILPFFCDVAQCQIDQLSRCIIARKMALSFEHLAFLYVQTFDLIGRVNDLSDFVRISEKRAPLVPTLDASIERLGGSFFPKAHGT